MRKVKVKENIKKLIKKILNVAFYIFATITLMFPFVALFFAVRECAYELECSPMSDVYFGIFVGAFVELLLLGITLFVESKLSGEKE